MLGMTQEGDDGGKWHLDEFIVLDTSIHQKASQTFSQIAISLTATMSCGECSSWELLVVQYPKRLAMVRASK